MVIDGISGERQMAEEYQTGRYRFRVADQWRYFTDQAIAAATCRRRTAQMPRELFHRRCNDEATIFQLSYHTHPYNPKYRGQFAVTVWAISRAAWMNLRKIVGFQSEQAASRAW